MRYNPKRAIHAGQLRVDALCLANIGKRESLFSVSAVLAWSSLGRVLEIGIRPNQTDLELFV